MSDAVSIEAILAHLEASIADARLSDEERRELVAMLRAGPTPEEGLRRVRNRAFELARARLEGAEVHALVKWLEGVSRALDAARAPVASIVGEACFSPGDGCLRMITQRLKSARERIDICVFTISDDRISQEIVAAHRRGIAVRVLTDDDKELDAGSDIDDLRRAGIPVARDRTAAHMHHKFALFDGQWLLNGSYNWTRSAAESNEENLTLTNDPALLSAFAAQFERLWGKLAG